MFSHREGVFSDDPQLDRLAWKIRSCLSLIQLSERQAAMCDETVILKDIREPRTQPCGTPGETVNRWMEPEMLTG